MATHCWVCKKETTEENSRRRNKGQHRAGVCKDCDQNVSFIKRWRYKSPAERQEKIKRLETMLKLLRQIEFENQRGI